MFGNADTGRHRDVLFATDTVARAVPVAIERAPPPEPFPWRGACGIASVTGVKFGTSRGLMKATGPAMFGSSPDGRRPPA